MEPRRVTGTAPRSRLRQESGSHLLPRRSVAMNLPPMQSSVLSTVSALPPLSKPTFASLIVGSTSNVFSECATTSTGGVGRPEGRPAQAETRRVGITLGWLRDIQEPRAGTEAPARGLCLLSQRRPWQERRGRVRLCGLRSDRP